MQRDRLEIGCRNVDRLDDDGARSRPAICITYHGWGAELREHFTETEGEGDPIPEENIDIAFRLQSSSDDADPPGVLSLAHRLTGELLLEANTDASLISNFVDVVNRFEKPTETDRCYSVQLWAENEPIITYEMRTLLVYASDGTLLRHRSLIPSGIEI